ncbi:MAG: DUF2845 domain-containing protein [Burkholderiales bacterium]|nr:DUF2845 domain-containing protein [Burkholderiales bacterium]
MQRSDRKDTTRAEFQLGVLDLHVLNNRRWGKPQRITRSREARAWHEYWAYQTGPNAGMQLHFVNGRLAGVENTDPPAPEASATRIEELAQHLWRRRVTPSVAIVFLLASCPPNRDASYMRPGVLAGLLKTLS